MKFNFTDAEVKKIMKELVIMIDTREQDCDRTIKYFERHGIKYVMSGLNHGDYSAKLPKGSIPGVDRDVYFTDDIVIEKKGNIDELCGNLKDKASRLKSEFAHLNKNNTKYFVFIQDGLYFKHLYNEDYRSKYKTNSLRARIKSMCAEYKTQIVPIPVDYMSQEIYETLYYEVRNILKKNFGVK